MTRCTCGNGHATFGECMRAKNIRVAYCQSWKNFDYTRAKRNERELAEYKRAREQGIQPAGTALRSVRKALDASDSIGSPFDAGNPSASFLEK
jgi:hypothetical protein